MGDGRVVGYFITWAQPQYFWLLSIVVLGILCIVVYAFRAHYALNALAVAQYRTTLLKGYSRISFFTRLCAVIMALILLWIALLRPQYPLGTPQLCYEYGRDIVVVVDVSRSMLVAGEAGVCDTSTMTRIERARTIIDTMLHHIKSERLALIAFSGSALTLCPLTKDATAFSMFVNLLAPDVLSGGGTTSLACALQEAVTLFSQQEQRTHKLLVIITDGEDFSPDLAEAQRKAKELGIHISIIGIGTAAGGPIPCYNEQGEKTGYQRDQQGIVISRLNESLLRNIAQQYHGLYISSSLTNAQITDKLLSWVRAREAERGAHYEIDNRGDLFMWCIAAALMILLITWI